MSTSRIDYAERRRQRAVERTKSRRRKIPVATLAGAAIAVVMLVGLDLALSWGRVHPGVEVAGVGVGGKSPAAASEALRQTLPKQAERPVAVVSGDESFEVLPSELGLEFDYDAMVDEAMGIGREGGPLTVVLGRAGAWFGVFDVPARPKVDPTRAATVWDRIAESTDVAAVDATVKITGVEPVVVPGKDGVALDKGSLEARVLDTILSEERTVEAPVGVAPVVITDVEAEVARDVAKQMLSAPASITYKDSSWEFQPEQIASWIVFKRSDEVAAARSSETTSQEAAPSEEITLAALVSAKRAGGAITEAVGAKVGKPAVDAKFTTAGGRVSIIASKTGVGPDTKALARDLTEKLTDPGSDRTVALQTTRIEPDLTTERARSMGIKERIARYTTTFASSARSRVNNIHLLGNSLDGTLIEPGGTFSFNDTIGERTAAKGYQEAGAIVNGEVVQQLGGGICQVGTTLFNTVFESGLPVVQRRNHSFYISHYPKGRDATVSWGGPDLRFKNDTDNWLLVSVSYTPSSITIALYGTDPGYDVSASTSEWRNIKPFPTRKIEDPDMYVGSKTVEDPGVTGRSITVKRTVQRAGEIVREDSFVSVYRPKVQVVRVGTKEKPKASDAATLTP